MIFLFGLSQMSSLVISLFNYNKEYVSILIEEESEKAENEEFNLDDPYYLLSQKMNATAFLSGNTHRPMPDASFITSYSNKPETPPPDFC